MESAAGSVAEGPSSVLLLVSGLPGSGKSTLCRAFLDAGATEAGEEGVDVHYLSFDEAEAAMAAATGTADATLSRDSGRMPGAVESHAALVSTSAIESCASARKARRRAADRP